MAKQEINPNTLLVIGGLGIAYFGLINPILKKLGIKKSSEEQAKEEAIKKADIDSAFNPDYWKIAPRPKLIFGASPTAATVAKEINSAFGYFNDDEERIYAAVKRARTKTMFSQVVSAYRDLYKADLYNTLKSKLSENEFFVIVKYVTALPDKTAK